ncbi:hypothetical protein DFH09DRAFT_1414639 [Mycena vulgaris]|nr:hypothetical protein DFH09DRAFT_1414639 [Mycena vulgaris]
MYSFYLALIAFYSPLPVGTDPRPSFFIYCFWSRTEKMPDPISVTTTLITLATFIKDLLDLGQSIKRSIDKVGGNRRQIRDLTEDILHTLGSLAGLLQGREDTFQAPQLLNALGDLKADMLHVLSVVDRITPTTRRHRLRGFRSQLKNWLIRDDVEVEIQNLKRHINKCYIQFTAFSAARTEYTALRVEQAILVNDVENRVKLQRLEGMIARLLLDTQFGTQVVHQTAEIISSVRRAIVLLSNNKLNLRKDPTHETLESQYLSVQTMRLVDFLAKLTASNNLSCEIPLWDPAAPMEIMFLPPKLSVHVLHTILGMVIQIQDTHAQFPAEDIADDLLNLGSHLAMLGMSAEATASDGLTVQFLRCLASGHNSIGAIPRLAFSLYKLSKRYQYQLRYRLALQASQQSLGLCRLLSEVSPDVDNSAVFLSALIGHSHNLCMTGQLQDAIATARQAVVICRPILLQIFASYPFATGLQQLSPEDEWRAAKCCKALFALARALSHASHYHEAHEASMESLTVLLNSSGSIRPPSGRETDMIRGQLYKMAETRILSLSILADIVILYGKLSSVYRKNFTLQFLPILHAHAYLCDQETSSPSGDVEVQRQILLETGMKCLPAPNKPFLVDTYPRAEGVVKEAIWAFYVSDSPPEAVYPISPLVQNFFVKYFDLANAVLQKVVKSLTTDLCSNPKILSFAIAKISDTLSSVSIPQQLILLDTLTELIAHFRTLVISQASQEDRNYFTYALWWYCWALWLPGRLGEALAITHEAIQCIRSKKAEHTSELDDWLLDQAFIMFDMGRIVDASRVLEGINVSDKNDGDPGYFDYFVRSHLLRRTGKYQEAALLLADSVEEEDQEIEDRIASVDLAAVHLELGQFQAAVEYADKAVAVFRRHPQNTGTAEAESYKSLLAYGLITLSNCLAAVGRHEEGLVVSQEAANLVLALQRPLMSWPTVIRTQELMASALCTLSKRLMTARQAGEALSTAETATDLYCQLVLLAPRSLPSLASSLQNLASILWDVGRQEESIVARQEAVNIAHGIAENEPYFHSYLKEAIDNLERCRGDRCGSKC